MAVSCCQISSLAVMSEDGMLEEDVAIGNLDEPVMQRAATLLVPQPLPPDGKLFLPLIDLLHVPCPSPTPTSSFTTLEPLMSNLQPPVYIVSHFS
ncbi:unnamed protein product [Timema podura]|uniref:Uncharacterized protein n=1 Tax=Timema podura TaxID=61482 RepID=A0ABN7PCU6_TIMPD|nr:unnamed protein product [Timema podura]